MNSVDFELTLRALIGVTLLLFGFWLLYCCDRTFKGDLGWRGWCLLVSGALCFAASFVLLLYGASLSSPTDLL